MGFGHAASSYFHGFSLFSQARHILASYVFFLMICWLCDDYYALTTLTNRAWRVASCSSASSVFRCSCECFATLVFVERDLLDRLIFFFQDEMKAFARMGKAKPLRLIKLAVFLCLTCGKSMAFFFLRATSFLLCWDFSTGMGRLC